MTIEEKKAWLRRYSEIERHIDRLTEKIQRLASIAEKVTVTFSDNHTPGRAPSPQERTIEMIAEIQEQIVEKIKESEQTREEIETVIDNLEKQKHREVLRCRYLRGMSWEVIAVYLTYEYSWVTRLHNEALEILATKNK